jgi:hypothetical protein
MKVARFDPAGGPLFATITSGFAQPGSYELLLWEAPPAGRLLQSDADRPGPPRGSD